MKRPLFWTLLMTAVAATALAAQEPQPGGDKGEKKDLVDKSKDIMTRLAKNLAIVENKLKKVDPGDETRKIQRDIIDDLEELIKQNSNQQGSAGGGKSKKSKPDRGSQKDQSDTNKGGQNDKKSDASPDNNGQDDNNKGQVKPGKGDQGEGKDKNKGQGKEGDDKEGVAKTGGKDQDKKGENKKGEVKADDGKADGGQQTAGGKAKQDPPETAKKNLIADLHREVWGHLPDKMRLEMDAYTKERFMPRYEDLLQQYYRTIAEQASGKEK
jgi:hypothetical protein